MQNPLKCWTWWNNANDLSKLEDLTCYRENCFNEQGIKSIYAFHLRQKQLIKKCFVLSLKVSELFGGLEICSLAVIVGKDGKETILKASDCTFSLIGDTQEEDRRTVADIVTARMQVSVKRFSQLVGILKH